MNRDLTVGKPERVLWQYCMPLFGSIIFQQLYNLADSFVAGKFIGEEALAAVGNSYEITLIFIAFAFGCNIGCAVIVAQLFGAREYRDMKTAVSTTMVLSAATCAVLMAIGLGLCTPLLTLIHTPGNILADSRLYLRIYVLGLPFVFFYNVATGIFSALGDSKTPFWFLAASSLSNIFVDILFVTTFQMGVAGVAWATFLCQCVSCVLAVIVVVRRLEKVCAGEKAPLFDGGLLKRIVVIDVTGEDPILLINPVIIETSGEQTGNEGCLSLPGKTGVVTRPNYVKVRAYDEEMKPFEIEGTELLARAFCHEIDHLDGHLYVEKVEGELMSTESPKQ